MWVDRLEAVVEAHVLPAAHVRERCSAFPGISARTAYLCRDKVAMKEVLREAGVPTAASAGISSVGEAVDFVEAVGFPVILKPRAAAGRLGHLPGRQPRTSSPPRRGRAALADGAPVAIEEFVEGHEGFYDTLTVNGARRPRLHQPLLPERARGDAHPLDLAADRRDQPHGRPGYDEVSEMGQRVSAGARHRHRRRPTWSGSSARRACASPRSAAGRPASASGTATAPATSSTSTASGRSRSATASPSGRRRGATPAASSRSAPTATAGSPATRAPRRSSDRYGELRGRQPLPRAGHADAAGRGGLHGQCLDAGAPSRLRRAARAS